MIGTKMPPARADVDGIAGETRASAAARPEETGAAQQVSIAWSHETGSQRGKSTGRTVSKAEGALAHGRNKHVSNALAQTLQPIRDLSQGDGDTYGFHPCWYSQRQAVGSSSCPCRCPRQLTVFSKPLAKKNEQTISQMTSLVNAEKAACQNGRWVTIYHQPRGLSRRVHIYQAGTNLEGERLGEDGSRQAAEGPGPHGQRLEDQAKDGRQEDRQGRPCLRRDAGRDGHLDLYAGIGRKAVGSITLAQKMWMTCATWAHIGAAMGAPQGCPIQCRSDPVWKTWEHSTRFTHQEPDSKPHSDRDEQWLELGTVPCGGHCGIRGGGLGLGGHIDGPVTKDSTCLGVGRKGGSQRARGGQGPDGVGSQRGEGDPSPRAARKPRPKHDWKQTRRTLCFLFRWEKIVSLRRKQALVV